MADVFTNEELQLLHLCPLLARLNDDEILKALDIMRVRKRSFAKGEMVQRVGDPYRYAGFVLKGVVMGSFITETYDSVELARFERGDMYGLSLAISQPQSSPVQMKALTDVDMALFDFSITPPQEMDRVTTMLARNITRTLVSQNRYLHRRVMILGQGSIRNRLICYLTGCETDSRGFAYVPYTRSALASFLGVNRSALSREMSHMVEEGLLEVDGNRMRVIR